MNIAIVLAGGVGKRVGARIPKQFIEVLGKPIFVYCLEAFERNPLVDEIVLVCVESFTETARKYCQQFGISKVHRIVPGGADYGAGNAAVGGQVECALMRRSVFSYQAGPVEAEHHRQPRQGYVVDNLVVSPL